MKYCKSIIVYSILITCANVGFSQNPGGISTNLNLWMKADAGVTGTTTVTSWMDQTSNAYNFTQSTSGKEPALEGVGINYNPGIRFDGGDGISRFLSRPDSVYNPDADHVFFMAIKSGTSDGVIFSSLVTTIGKLYKVRGQFQNNTASGNINSDPSISSGDAYIVRCVQDSISSSLNVSNYISGKSLNSGTHAQITGTITRNNIGGGPYGGHGGNGAIMGELILYQTLLGNVDVTKIESYLAIKYGITLSNFGGGTNGDYVSSGANTLWDADLTSQYHNQVIGVGRDDASGLLQKQSHQDDDTTRIYLATLQTTNAANTGTFNTDGQFVLMGNDGNALQSLGSTEYPSGLGIYSRIEREWKITNTAFTGSFSLDIKLNTTPLNASDLRILIDGDGNFTNAVMYNPTIGIQGSMVTISGLSTTHIPANSTRYLTIVSLSGNSPLPVGLIDFNATVQENHTVYLTWQTASETNNDYFTVEHSKDGMHWDEIGKVKGAGNSSTLLSYHLTDAHPPLGESYYRLKQTDFDGVSRYSSPELVYIGSETDFLVYPNPSEGHVYIFGEVNQLDKIEVISSVGQNVTSLIDVLLSNKKNDQITLDISSLRQGVYYLILKEKVYRILKK